MNGTIDRQNAGQNLGHKPEQQSLVETSHGFFGGLEKAAQKINSPKLRQYLLNQYKEDLLYSAQDATQLQKRYAELLDSIGHSETIERSVLEKITEGGTPGLEILEWWVRESHKSRSLWGSVEDWFSSLGEDMRIHATHPIDQIRTQISLGIIQGVYRGVKGVVVAIPQLLELGWKLLSEPQTRAQAVELYKRYLIWNVKLHFGTPSMRAEAGRELVKVLDLIWDMMCTAISEQWEQAEEEGRLVELVSTWVGQGLFEIATAMLAFTKGAQAVKAARAAAPAGKAAQASKASKVAEAASHAKVVTKVDPPRIRVRKPILIPQTEVLEVLGEKATAVLRKAPRKIQRKILRDLSEFIPSKTTRLGKVVEGRQAFAVNEHLRERIIQKMIVTLEKIEKGQPVDVFMIIKQGTGSDPTKYLREAMRRGLKGPGFKAFMSNADGNRMGPGRYVTVGEYHTSRFEVFPDGNVQKGYAILKAKFRPREGLQYDFKIVPSVREPGGGVNIVDKFMNDTGSFRNVELLWDGKWRKIE